MLVWAEIVCPGMPQLTRTELTISSSVIRLHWSNVSTDPLSLQDTHGEAAHYGLLSPHGQLQRTLQLSRCISGVGQEIYLLDPPWFKGRIMTMIGFRDTECSIRIAISSNSCYMLELPSHLMV